MHTTHTQTANAQRPISNEVTSEFQSGKAEATVGLAAIENLSMEIHQLRYFVAVANEGSFSRAAAKVRVAQPSLSQQIRKLEAEVGQPLFDRLPFSRPDRSGPLFDRLRTANFGLDRRRPPMRRRAQRRGCRRAGGGRNSHDRAICPPGIDREIPKTLSSSHARNRGGRDRRHHSAGGSWRAGCRIGIHLPAKSNSATRTSGQRTIACASAERTFSSKEASGNIGRSQIAEVPAPPRDALPVATGESPARGPSSPAGDSAGRQPAWNDR